MDGASQPIYTWACMNPMQAISELWGHRARSTLVLVFRAHKVAFTVLVLFHSHSTVRARRVRMDGASQPIYTQAIAGTPVFLGLV
jgi:hypothetical protein